MRRLARWLGLLLALAPLAAAAEIYQWTDEQGRVHYTQDLDQVPARHRSQAELRALAPHEAGRLQTYSQPAAPDPGERVSRAATAARARARVPHPGGARGHRDDRVRAARRQRSRRRSWSTRARPTC